MRPADTTLAVTNSDDAVNPPKQHKPCQVGAPLSSLADLIDIAFASHNRSNGATVSLHDGNMEDKKLFTVSIYPEHAQEFWERPTWQELFDFAKARLDLLSKADHALGIWFNDYELIHVIDVVICIPDCELALELGRRFDQVAIFDLETRREIPISHVSLDATVKLVEVGND